MAPLSHDLAGIVLPHDYFGSHLDSSGKTIDQDLEVKSFQKAAEVLSEVWEKTVIDGYPVHCKAVEIGKEYEPPTPDPVWVEKHFQQSRYCLQIVKCEDQSCCSQFETNWLKTIPERFIPFPAIYEYSENGYRAMEPSKYFQHVSNPSMFAPLTHRLLVKSMPSEVSEYKVVPFDLYCPSMKDKLKKGICKKCDKYWPSEAAMKRHKNAHRKQNRTIETESESDTSENESHTSESESDARQICNGRGETDIIPVFDNIFDVFKSPFVEA